MVQYSRTLTLRLSAGVVTLVALLANFSAVKAVDLNLFYPFGPTQRDSILQPGDDSSSPEITLDERIFLYNNSYDSLFVNTNGHVSFGSPVPDYRPDRRLPFNVRVPVIAVFLADVDTSRAGRIYYRSTSESSVIQRAAADVQTYFSGFESFLPTSLFIVTWESVGYYNAQYNKTNTFQLVLASDGDNSFSLFHYRSDGMEWQTSQGKFSSYPDAPPQAGFEGDMGQFFGLRGSGETGDFVAESNVAVPGVWMYHIGNLPSGNVQPADLKTGDVTLFEVGTDTTTTTNNNNCLRGASTCDSNAQCIDHGDSFCCECVPPFYGNGLVCLEPGEAQVMNGKVSGRVNEISFNAGNMHTYIVATDGRTYSAIDGLPDSLVGAFQTLTSVGGIAGWLFANKTNPQARNGFGFTGGKFNRTARVTFTSQDGRTYVLRISQTSMGHYTPRHMDMDTVLEGSLPDIPKDARVTIDDYHENYKKTGPGTIKSFVGRIYRVGGVAYRYSWDNTITFNECERDRQRNLGDVMRLSVTRHYTNIAKDKKVVRYAMKSKISIYAGSNPCSNAGELCNEHSDCVPEGDSYKCICKSGYIGDGVTCTDVDECTLDPCDTNAVCYNVQGAFQCRCRQGYEGDGRTCTLTNTCGDYICAPDARCVGSSQTRDQRCECNPGFRGDGLRCAAAEQTCNEVDICADNAECVYDEDLRQHVCECQDEFSGDGYTCEALAGFSSCDECDRYADCDLDENINRYRCTCRHGFTGDGRRCDIIDECRQCDRYARCHFNENAGSYECACVRGYKGDGLTCEMQDCREDESMCAEDGGLCWFDKTRNISICRCNYGYRGDGFRCEKVGCDLYNDCDSNAECVTDGRTHFCRCNDGYSGDGRRCRPERGGCDVTNDCDANARCLRDAEGRFHCRCNRGYRGDGKTCEQTVVPCNQVNNCDRNAECLYDPDTTSYQCRCSRGYEGNGVYCRRREIVDCRRDTRLCSPYAECVKGAEEEYVCVCRPGYRGDGATCSPVIQEGNFLVYAQGNKIMRISADSDSNDYGRILAYEPGMLAVGLDIDCQEGDIYWTDAAKGNIKRSKLNGTGMETVVNGMKSPEGIAVDFVARNMFFTDSEMDSLHVARLNGSDMKTLVNTEMVNPRAIVLDVNQGVIYWTDWNRNRAQIERINMDGTNRSVVVTDDLGLPNGLAFDTFSQSLCWGDAGTHRIECIRSDGINRRVVYDRATYPFDIALLNNNIYWTDWQRRVIPNVKQSGGDANGDLRHAVGGHGRAYGIAAVRDSCPRVRNSCGLNNGGCKYLCLPTARGGRTCECPDGVDPRVCQM